MFSGVWRYGPVTLAEVYGAKINALALSLEDEDTKFEAIELLRSLVTEVRLHPDENADGGYVIELYGELAAILELVGPRNDKTHRFTGGGSVSMVAGARFGHCFQELHQTRIYR